MPQHRIIRQIFVKHKYQLLLTYFLFTLEMLGLLFRPFFLGIAINGLIKNSYEGLVWLAASHLLWMAAGTIRHMYDTRTYSAIYITLVQKIIKNNQADADVSKLSAHSTLAREMVDFLEYDLNYVLEAAYNLLGSLVLLFYYDKKVVLVCLAALLPVSIISHFYGKKMKGLNKGRNDELEKQVDAISSKNVGEINQHYQSLRRWQIKISDSEAWNFGAMELMVIIVLIVTLFISVKNGSTTMLAGDILGIYNYVLKFVSGLDTIPYTLQRLSQLNDIATRIESEDWETGT